MSAPEIDQAALIGLLEDLRSRHGYDLRGYALPSLTRRIRAAMARSNMPDLAALRRRALDDPAFFRELLDSLTVRVSEMFRDPEFYAAFRSEVVPVLRTYPLLRVWHAGTASGEEAYSMAILLLEEGLYERAQIYATDLNEQAVEAAKQGIYPAARLAHFADNYRRAGGLHELSRYVTVAYGNMAVRESLKRHIAFFHHDLVADQVFGEMHAVFCRNVLIYFGRALQAKVLEKLGRSLCPGGFLCLGANEQLPRSNPSFHPFVRAQRIYRCAA